VTKMKPTLCRVMCLHCGNVEVLPLSSTKNVAYCKICDFRFKVDGEYKRESISAERLAEMREAVLKYGPSNCWTGTTGTLAAMVFELLRAIGEERGT
jgi:hypothetical protein